MWPRKQKHTASKKAIIEYSQAEKMIGDVIIPDTMSEIKGRLFDGNKNITSVVIPGTVKKIGDRAFAGCENLKTVILNEGIEEIGSNVFTGCKNLRTLTYPDSVTKYQGWTFYRTNLSAPVLNASGTILIFCPESVSGKEWSVPDTVKTISWQAFIESKDLEILHLPEGLEKIEHMAFIECGFAEITIPFSVREIGSDAFYYCDNLEKITILNPYTKLENRLCYECENLKEINYAGLTESDRIFHLMGQPFLLENTDDPSNLNHTKNSEFLRLAKKCALGDTNSMYDMALFFENCSHISGASPFYIRAANYWRYRAYCRGHEDAVKWFTRFFAEHPGEHLESILSENSDHRANCYTYSVSGSILNELGYSFFEPEKDYEIKQSEGEDLVIASAFESYEPPDDDGFGAEYYYDWWFLDENMQPIPGIRRLNSTVRETNSPFFMNVKDKAVRILKERKLRRVKI